MPSRPVLREGRVSAAAAAQMESFHASTIREIESAIASHDVVVVGMAQNPYVKKARKALERANIPHHYLEYGSYLFDWRQRLAIKLWSGWPTFPQVFVKGELLGGFDLTAAAVADGSLAKKLGR